ncbi:hypothetical protein CEXT_512801 [Caerostris extrusa]|uniref:Uncharacterized protein n=1 Tax=Caerostris extrusa TaxID=172846 RepID=A0AAV4MQQ5_CAEEX|nr:hypothetical protein CEXT_512801 [Caerostris extrusa]
MWTPNKSEGHCNDSFDTINDVWPIFGAYYVHAILPKIKIYFCLHSALRPYSSNPRIVEHTPRGTSNLDTPNDPFRRCQTILGLEARLHSALRPYSSNPRIVEHTPRGIPLISIHQTTHSDDAKRFQSSRLVREKHRPVPRSLLMSRRQN